MVDNNLIQAILDSKFDNGFIEDGDFLPLKTMKLLSKFPLCNNAKIVSLFKKNRDARYSCEIQCPICGDTRIIEKLSKTKVLEAVKEIKNYRRPFYSYEEESMFLFCENCKKEKEKEKKEIARARQVEEAKSLEEKTAKYIDTYLDPEKFWKRSVSTYKKISQLQQYVKWREVEEYIQDMDYYDFLKTPYWKAIAEKVRNTAKNRCMICNSRENLNVHHRTYEHHGDELHHLGDLVCLCHECHEKHHFE